MTVSGADLVGELGKVRAPASGGFSVVDVPAAPGYKIGRGADGVIVLLTPADAQPEPPTRLRTLDLDPRIRVSLEDVTGTIEAEHGLVRLRLEDPGLLEPFLDVAAAIVRLLGPSPGPGEVSAAMRRLVRIFDPAQPPRGSILGLWAELLVILKSRDPAVLVDAWHAYVDARFDFATAGSRLEVKATTKDVREHQFALRQLEPVQGAVVHVASLMTTETHAGTSVGQLVERVEAILSGDARRQIRVHEQVASTLGAEWVRHAVRQFDERQGAESLVVLPAEDIPKVAPPPPEVVDVRLTVDCTDVAPETAPTGLAALISSDTS